MNNTSFQNIVKLVKKFFVERWKIEMIIFLAIFLACFFMSLLFRLTHSPILITFITGIFITSIAFAATIFSELRSKTSSLMYLSLPASSLEKLISKIIISHIIRPLSFFIAGFSGIILAFVFKHQIFSTDFEDFLREFVDVTISPYFILIIIISAMMLSISIFTFGSVYFKRAAFIKTLLSLLVIFTIWAVLNACVSYIIFTYFGSETHIHYTYVESHIYKIISICVMWIVTIFFWVLSYFRLRETEV